MHPTGRRINAIDADEDITLVSVQHDANKEIFDVDTLDGEEVFVAEQNENVVEEVVDAAQVSTEEITLAQALADLKSTKPKAKGIAFKELERNGNAIAEEEKIDEANIALTEEWDDIQAKIKADREFAQRLQAGEQEELNKPPIQAQQRKIMCTYLKNMEGKKLKDLKNKSFDSIQKMFDRAFKRVNTFVDFRTDLVEGSLKRAGEEEDLEDLYKLVKARYGSTRLVEDLDLVLWNDLKNMFEPHVEDEIWKLQQRYAETRSFRLIISVKWHISFLNFSQNSLRINEVFGSILLVIMELLMEKLDDFGDKYRV
ncbi:hypothetical protein Tco_1245648 [Tanacetum coccineum]